MDRGIRASVDGQNQAKTALKRKGWSQEYLAGASGCSRQTVNAFLARRPIDSKISQRICEELGLEWGEIAEIEVKTQTVILNNIVIDQLVREVREKVSSSIQSRCGFMRVLDMTYPITIDSIYTSVNILEKLSRNQRYSTEELLMGCDLSSFNRLGLGRIQSERVPGLEAVSRHKRLMILGKPGAGKTTFLKWLAFQCKEGHLYEHKIPFFVTLKEFAEAKGQPILQVFLARQLQECQVTDGMEVIQHILHTGRAIILLDGLDEVRSRDHDRILADIRQTAQQYELNQFIITCRIAAREYIFEQFTEVEVADFNEEQIVDFSQKWFQSKDTVKAKEFPQNLATHPGLKELSTNPLLLTLLCLVYEEQGGFPTNRSEIYAEGLNVLMKKWDVTRNVKREEVYRKLPLKRKEDLLSRIAHRTFTASEYFFKQKFLEHQIQQYMCNLPNASDNEDALRLDGEAVLKSIEAQHGLLVERARGIYSFSHLTFQEFFAARYFKEESHEDYSDLVDHITEKHWREVFLLTVGMLNDADSLLKAMKQRIDNIVADEKLQQFLAWVEHKSFSEKVRNKSAVVKACFFALSCSRSIALNRALALKKALKNALALGLARPVARPHGLARARALAFEHAFALALTFDSALNNSLDNALALDRSLSSDRDFAQEQDLARALERDRINKIGSTELKKSLQEMSGQLPKRDDDLVKWWNLNGKEWTEKLQSITIEYRDIGHNDWQFSEIQEQLMHEYYEANLLLVDCLQSDCYVSREVRAEIEDTLLLPLSSIQTRKRKK